MPLSQADNQPEEVKPAAPPLDPRRAPDVLYALAHAARRDPHPDPLKSIGRASFVIWMGILATLFFSAELAHKYVNVPVFRTDVLMTYRSLVDNHPTPARAIKQLKRDPHKIEILAVTGFAAGTLFFALYYLAVYLIGMNTRHVLADAAARFDEGKRRIAAWRAQMRAEPKGSKHVIVENTTAAGHEPHIQ